MAQEPLYGATAACVVHLRKSAIKFMANINPTDRLGSGHYETRKAIESTGGAD